MNDDFNELIRSYFDFGYEDQPDSLSGYDIAIDSMWNYANLKNCAAQLRRYIETVLNSGGDVATDIGFYFLPGKHDPAKILRLALERQPHD